MLEVQTTLITLGAIAAVVLWIHVLRPVKATNPFGI